MVLEEVGRQVELMDSFRESVMQATHESISQIESQRSAHEEVMRQIELMDSFRESVMQATHEPISQIELERSAHEEVMRQIERMDSFRESVMQATHEPISQIELERSAHEEMMRQIERMDSFREEARRQSELMMPIVSGLLDYAVLKNTKSTNPNTSDYCREWNWELYSLTDYHWYYHQQSLFRL